MSEDIRIITPEGAESIPSATAGNNGGSVPPPKTPGSASDQPPDPFDPLNLRLSQDYIAIGGVKKHLTVVPVRKPLPEEWARVHPAAEYALDTLILELKGGSRESYLIAPELRVELATESVVGPRRIHTAINRQGTLFLWPARLPRNDGRTDNWCDSMLEAVDAAKTTWVRIRSDMGLGAYVFETPLATLSLPEWPPMAFSEMLRVAFKTNFIETRDHPVLRRLRGEL